MATYAIGDIQGCFRTLERLLRRISFAQAEDRLWLVGDLVNRGPDSLAVLRWAYDLREHLRVVLGNHDLQLIGLADGTLRRKCPDSLRDVLKARDRDRLIGWLRMQPLVHREERLVMVHAGLLPGWTAEQAVRLGGEVEAVLRNGSTRKLFRSLDGGAPLRWNESLEGGERLAAITAVLTRLRTCRADGRMCLSFSGPPDLAPAGCKPWFELRQPEHPDELVVFGHWAAAGLRQGTGFLGLDTGCVWGRVLTAVRLEDRIAFQEPLADRV